MLPLCMPCDLTVLDDAEDSHGRWTTPFWEYPAGVSSLLDIIDIRQLLLVPLSYHITQESSMQNSTMAITH